MPRKHDSSGKFSRPESGDLVSIDRIQYAVTSVRDTNNGTIVRLYNVVTDQTYEITWSEHTGYFGNLRLV